jgi:hypothetical protein
MIPGATADTPELTTDLASAKERATITSLHNNVERWRA